MDLSGYTETIGSIWDDDMGNGSGSLYVLLIRDNGTHEEVQKLTSIDG